MLPNHPKSQDILNSEGHRKRDIIINYKTYKKLWCIV